MKWLDEIAQHVSYPLRATWFDKALIVIHATNICFLVALCIVALIQWLCA